MTQFISAIYEHGVFRPLEPIELAEHQKVSLLFAAETAAAQEAVTAIEAATASLQRHALAALREKMDALPDRAPQDGLGGADHDLILYGKSE